MPRLRVTLGGTIATTQRWSNTLEFLTGGPAFSQASLQAFVNAVQTAVVAGGYFRGLAGGDTILTSTKALYYPSNTGTASLVATSTSSAGAGIVTATLPPQVCAVASLRTALAGKSSRGRIFTPYRGTDISPAGVLNSAGQTLVAGYVNGVVGAIATAAGTASISVSWVVWSPKLGAGTPITAVLVGSQCDTIRHRNINRGETYASFSPPSLMAETSDPSIAEALQNAAAATIGEVRSDSPTGLSQALGIITGVILDSGEGDEEAQNSGSSS
jgi:hypothetical protein